MRSIFAILCFLFLSPAFGQDQEKPYQLMQKGKKAYEEQAYSDAVGHYQHAGASNEYPVESSFNLGNALYRQDSLQQAAEQFQMAANLAKDKKTQAQAYHNLGNAYLQQKEYQKSIDAYKDALRRNPHDEETRYNLAYAKKMLEQQQNQDQNNDNKDNKDEKDKKDNKDNKDNKDDKGDKGDKDNKDSKDNKDKNEDKEGDGKDDKSKEGDKKDEDKDGKGKDKQQEQKKPENMKGSMSKDEVEKILNALEQEEGQLRKGIRLKEEKSEPKHIEKNW